MLPMSAIPSEMPRSLAVVLSPEAVICDIDLPESP